MTTHVPNTKAANLTALGYFMGQSSELGASLAWKRLQTFETETRERFGYVNYLVNLGKPHAAFEVFDPAADIMEISNGDFERNPMNGGFDWRYSSWEHAEARRDTTQSKDGMASFLSSSLTERKTLLTLTCGTGSRSKRNESYELRLLDEKPRRYPRTRACIWKSRAR